MLTSARIKDGNIGKLIQLIELDVPLSLFAIMIYLRQKSAILNTIQCALETHHFGQTVRTEYKDFLMWLRKINAAYKRAQANLEFPKPGTKITHLPEYKVFSDDGLNSLVTPNISV